MAKRISYKTLLQKYIELVLLCEGESYVSQAYLMGLSDGERAALEAAEAVAAENRKEARQ